MKVKRLSAGDYEVTGKNGLTVSVFSREGEDAYGDKEVMWMAVADWCTDLYSDPLETKRDALISAAYMLEEPEEAERRMTKLYRVEMLEGGKVMATARVHATNPERACRKAMDLVRKKIGNPVVEAEEYRWTEIGEKED